MKKLLLLVVVCVTCSCATSSGESEVEKTGLYRGGFRYGNFSDTVQIRIEKDSSDYRVFFTSLAQNANNIPFQGVTVNGDSISFKLQSDFYTYAFSNQWTADHSKLNGTLRVDTIAVGYTLEKILYEADTPKNEEVTFDSNGLMLHGTIWYPKTPGNKALVIVTSSGNADRSASRAEAIQFAQRGYTTFHYDKRGTGNSEGDWGAASIAALASDDITAIQFFSGKTGIGLSNIGIKGSSQGATKIPLILNKLKDLAFGIAVSCPGVTLLESDLNYWKNRNAAQLGDALEDAAEMQGKVFEFIAGKLSKDVLEKAIGEMQNKPWRDNIWVPDLNTTRTDKKLLFSPIPHFEQLKHPVLVVQGTLDEIIPANSYQRITDALEKSGNEQFKTVLLDGGSHSMYYVGESDFPYWSKLHPDYLTTIEDWISTVDAAN